MTPKRFPGQRFPDETSLENRIAGAKRKAARQPATCVQCGSVFRALNDAVRKSGGIHYSTACCGVNTASTGKVQCLAIGDIVEWDIRTGGVDRGVVSSITESRVYVRNQRVGTRGRNTGKVYDCEFWWAVDEVGELRIVPLVGRNQPASPESDPPDHQSQATENERIEEMTPYDMVRQFHAHVGQPESPAPDISQHRELRLSLIREELDELVKSLDADDIVGVADALGDLLYVVIGSALQWGIQLERVVAEIHRSNMTKSGRAVRVDGKILKGPEYSPPDLSWLVKP